MVKVVGVLALQGAFSRHAQMVDSLSSEVKACEVRGSEDLQGCDALIVPGGESTVISKLVRSSNLVGSLQSFVEGQKPIFGTCAGMIVLASEVEPTSDAQLKLGAIDVSVERNGYGRQLNSFEADLQISAVGDKKFRGVFIRAPKVTRVGDGVEVLAYHQQDSSESCPVLCRQGSVMVSAFHPELTEDGRLHQLFLDSFL